VSKERLTAIYLKTGMNLIMGTHVYLTDFRPYCEAVGERLDSKKQAASSQMQSFGQALICRAKKPRRIAHPVLHKSQSVSKERLQSKAIGSACLIAFTRQILLMLILFVVAGMRPHREPTPNH
jgi:hypothetical protein